MHYVAGDCLDFEIFFLWIVECKTGEKWNLLNKDANIHKSEDLQIRWTNKHWQLKRDCTYIKETNSLEIWAKFDVKTLIVSFDMDILIYFRKCFGNSL